MASGKCTSSKSRAGGGDLAQPATVRDAAMVGTGCRTNQVERLAACRMLSLRPKAAS
jgi:hypothetical protein